MTKNIYGISPQFEHDCETCTFIQRTIFGDRPVDEYVHLKVNDYAGTQTYDLNVVFRFSDEPSDYTSWTETGVDFSISSRTITDPYGDEAEFEPMAEWEMELIMTWEVNEIVTPLSISGDLLARAKRNIIIEKRG